MDAGYQHVVRPACGGGGGGGGENGVLSCCFSCFCSFVVVAFIKKVILSYSPKWRTSAMQMKSEVAEIKKMRAVFLS